jgi:hypothetical protein
MERCGGDTTKVSSYASNAQSTSYCQAGDDRAGDIVAA